MPWVLTFTFRYTCAFLLCNPLMCMFLFLCKLVFQQVMKFLYGKYGLSTGHRKNRILRTLLKRLSCHVSMCLLYRTAYLFLEDIVCIAIVWSYLEKTAKSEFYFWNGNLYDLLFLGCQYWMRMHLGMILSERHGCHWARCYRDLTKTSMFIWNLNYRFVLSWYFYYIAFPYTQYSNTYSATE